MSNKPDIISPIRVFLASPGDLVPERKAAREMVDRLNRLLVQFGLFIELLAWEDTLPGFSRPQEKINEDVRSCDLFVGLIWRRWGQPTGEYSSGFEEEFELARQLRIDTGSPELWLFFKSIDEDLRADPGDQLIRVLQFKQSIQETHELFYKEFIDVEDWGPLLYDSLLQYVWDIYVSTTERAISQVDKVVSSPPEQVTQHRVKHEEADAQSVSLPSLFDIFSALEKSIEENELESSSISSVLEKTQVARLYLLSSSYMSSHTTNILDTHEINLIYNTIRDEDLSLRELYLLFRSIIADEHHVRPSWYFFREWKQGFLPDIIMELITSDTNLDVRINGLNLLSSMSDSIRYDYMSRDEFLEKLFRDQDENIVNAALSFILTTGNLADIPLLDKFASDKDWGYSETLYQIKIQLIARNNVNDVLSSNEYLDRINRTTYITLLEEHASSIDQENLHLGLEHEVDQVRYFSFRELLKRGVLEEASISEYLEDPYLPIRAESYSNLISSGKSFDIEDIKSASELSSSSSGSPRGSKLIDETISQESLIYRNLRNLPGEELRESIDWFKPFGNLAYKAYMDAHFSENKETIQKDLENKFESLKASSSQKMLDNFGKVGHKLLDDWGEDLHSFIQDKFIASAIEVINNYDEPDFIDVIRPFVESTNRNVLKGTIEYLGKYGNQRDLPAIIKIAENSYDDIQLVSTQVALSISQEKFELSAQFAASGQPLLVKQSVKSMLSNRDDIDFSQIKNFLFHQSDLTREAAIYVASEILTQDELGELLDEYIDNRQYFYNVVTWFDRFLYSPDYLSTYYMLKLKNELNQ